MDIFSESVTFEQPNQLFHNEGNGSFVDVSVASGPHFFESRVGRGVAFADYDNDGDVDVLVLNAGEAVNLLRNDGGSRENWLAVSLVGEFCNRGAVGARVEVETGSLHMVREVRSGASYLSQSDLRLSFGLGGNHLAERVRIRWPDGRRDTLTDVAANCLLVITEGKGHSEQPLSVLSRQERTARCVSCKRLRQAGQIGKFSRMGACGLGVRETTRSNHLLPAGRGAAAVESR